MPHGFIKLNDKHEPFKEHIYIIVFSYIANSLSPEFSELKQRIISSLNNLRYNIITFNMNEIIQKTPEYEEIVRLLHDLISKVKSMVPEVDKDWVNQMWVGIFEDEDPIFIKNLSSEKIRMEIERMLRVFEK